jgi:hypothetical protein
MLATGSYLMHFMSTLKVYILVMMDKYLQLKSWVLWRIFILRGHHTCIYECKFKQR